jgi:signal transduction histidine kinase
LSGLLNFIVSLVIGFLIFLKDPKRLINKSYFLYCISISYWSFGYWQWLLSSNKGEVVFWIKFLTAGAILIPIFYFNFILTFLKLDKNAVKKRVLRLGYFLSLTFFLLSFTQLLVRDAVPKLNFPFWPVPGSLYPLYLLIFSGYIGYSIYLLMNAMKKSIGYRKNQIKYVLIGSILGFSGGFTNFPLWYNVPIYPFGNFAVLLFFIFFTYAVIRFKLLDITVIMKKTAAYSLSAGLLTSLFVILVLTLTNLFSIFTQVSSFKVSIFVAIIIAILFNPLRNRIQRIIDRLFYKRSYDYYTAIRKVSYGLASMFDFNEIYSFVGESIFSILGLKNIFVLSGAPSGGYEIVYQASKKSRSKKENGNNDDDGGAVKIGRRSGIVKLFRKSQNVIIKDELQDDTKYRGKEIIELINNDLALFYGEAAVPVFVDGKLFSMIILGEKMSGDMFTNEDINLLNTIANQTAIAIKNAGLYEDKVNSERLASMGMMSATFAHEIRNPLTSLKTFAQLMPEKYNDEEFRDTFSKIVVGEIERIDGLIGDLLDFSAEKKSTRLNNFNLVSLVDETIHYVEGKLEVEERDIDINKIFMEDEVYMSGDAEKMKQTFINILMNGCQAMNGEGYLTVEIQKNSKYVNVSITDTGKGIHPDDISTIFDPFVTTREMGVGLGLAISKRVIEDHHGKISVKSKLAKGTTFTVSLPVQN